MRMVCPALGLGLVLSPLGWLSLLSHAKARTRMVCPALGLGLVLSPLGWPSLLSHAKGEYEDEGRTLAGWS